MGNRLLGSALALAAALLALGAPAEAPAYDPSLRWHTLETPHFQVHFHDGLLPLAQKAARACEAAHRLLTPLLRHAPGERVQVVITDDTDDANGSATAYLRPTLRILAVAPDGRSELNDHEDWLWNLVVHEYAHILHLDNVGGVPALANAVVGQQWIPNSYQPKWFIEGLAIWAETKLSGGGRDRSSLYDMFLRAQVLEGGLWGIDKASGSPSHWPRGATAYLHGARFLDWAAFQYGTDLFARISESYGSEPIPLAINANAREQLGASWVELYEAWRLEATEAIQAEIDRLRERGVTPFTRLTFRGEGTGEPRFLPDGRIVYLEDSADRRASLRRIGLEGKDEPLAELYGGGGLAVAADGSFAVVSQTLNFEEHSWFEDLFRVDLTSGRLERLGRGQRLGAPDLSPDGRLVVATRRRTGGRMELVTLSSSGGEPEVVYAARENDSLFTPRFSPDGRRVAFSENRRSGRDVRVLDLLTGRVEDVTDDRALDVDPTWDPSGRWLLFSSDRGGAYDLYARDLGSGETFRVTTALTGAFRPAVSPDGQRLAFVTFSLKGYDVAEMPFAPETWTAARPMASPRPPPPDWESRQLFPVRAYSPLDTLLPRYWLPSFGADPLGPTLGLTTGGSDIAGRHAWSLSADLGLTSLKPGFDAGYAARVAWPTFSAGAGSRLYSLPKAPEGYVDRQSWGSVGASLPFTFPDWRLSLSAGYELRHYSPDEVPRPIGPADDLPLFPRKGLAATASLGLGLSSSQRFANAISAERGGSFGVSGAFGRPEIGSQFSFGKVDAYASRYLALPWLEHHALALRISGGLAGGDLGGRKLFSLGGIGWRDPLLDAIGLRGSYGAALRGYEPGAFWGNQYALANAEYRFPLAALDSGFWTLPFFVRRVHGAVTFDCGGASDALAWRDLRPSAGAELRTELLLGYGLFTELRLGWARGMAPDGIHELFLSLGGSY